jgi:hypothetical protein
MRGLIRSKRSGAAIAVLTAVVSAGCSASSGSLGPGTPDNVPIELGIDSLGTPIRMYVQVQLGTAPPFKALLDTGSSGLRVVTGTVPDEAFASISHTGVSYAYGTYTSSVTISGVVAFAQFTIDRLTTSKPIPVMLVLGSGCLQGESCRTLQDEFSEAPAILGIGAEGLSGDYGIGNPIAQLPGHPPFVVHVTAAGPPTATLRIGRLATDATAFQTFQLASLGGAGSPLADGTPVWNDFSIPSCIEDETTGSRYCFPSLWDTGDPTSYVASSGQPAPYTSELALGTAVNVTVGPVTAPMGSYQFVVGAYPAPGVDEVQVEPQSSGGYINLGMALFIHYDALFDQENGIVGLARH